MQLTTEAQSGLLDLMDAYGPAIVEKRGDLIPEMKAALVEAWRERGRKRYAEYAAKRDQAAAVSKRALLVANATAKAVTNARRAVDG